ncbi:sensor histidine kinase [Aquipuribacter sp. MA13-6]|uniref:sensor histidine kinase n=1 Tax=unclassified Aquipuribacter TaxID=2635084 RepID=UPI003EF050AA
MAVVGAVPQVYRGPDRRRRHDPVVAHPSTPPAATDDLGEPGVPTAGADPVAAPTRGPGGARSHRGWRRAVGPVTTVLALLALAVLVLLTLPDAATAALLRLSGDMLVHPSTASLLRHLVTWVLVAAGVAGLVRWRLDGRAPEGLLSAALLVLGGGATVVTRAEDLVLAVETVTVASPLLVALLAVPVVVAATTTGEVDSGLRPGRVLVRTSVATAAAAVLAVLTAAVLVALVPPAQLPAWSSSVWSASAVVWAAGALRVLVRPGALPRRWATVTGVLLLALVLGAVGRGLAHLVPLPGAEQAAATSMHVLVLVAAALVGRCALVDTRRALDAVVRRDRELSLRLAADEAVLQGHAEKLHDARSSVAGIRSAAAAIEQLADRLDPLDRADLEEGVAVELSRLERLLSRPGTARTSTTAVDDVVRPLVVLFRERGQRLVWEPSGTLVGLDEDALARVVANLLTNALVHAPGATVRLGAAPYGSDVRITVEDDGPGVPASLRATVFGSGICGGPGAGDGLGLPVVRRLARAAGGDCRLLGDHGARFVLDLPAADGRGRRTGPGGSATAAAVPTARGVR